MIRFINTDDWVWIYGDDGSLLYDYHQVDPEQLLDLLGIEYQEIWADDYFDNQEVIWDMSGAKKLEDWPEELLKDLAE